MKKNIPYLVAIIILISILIYLMTNKVIINLVGQLKSNGEYSKRDTDLIKEITIHHTAVQRDDYSPFEAANYHVSKKGWPAIGYHYFISKSGRIFKTNNDDTISYHNGFSNSISLGIVLNGNFENEYPTKKQIKSLKFLVKKLKNKHKNLNELICHTDYPSSNTACPGNNLIPIVRGIQKDLLMGNKYLSVGIDVVFSSVSNSYDPNVADN